MGKHRRIVFTFESLGEVEATFETILGYETGDRWGFRKIKKNRDEKYHDTIPCAKQIIYFLPEQHPYNTQSELSIQCTFYDGRDIWLYTSKTFLFCQNHSYFVIISLGNFETLYL
jgi:hypothetical protein